MNIDKIEEIIRIHSTTNAILGEDGFVFRKFETETAITFAAYLDKSSRRDRMEINYQKEKSLLTAIIECNDKYYLEYMTMVCVKKGIHSIFRNFLRQAYFTFNSEEQFKQFMLDDFEEFMVNYKTF